MRLRSPVGRFWLVLVLLFAWTSNVQSLSAQSENLPAPVDVADETPVDGADAETGKPDLSQYPDAAAALKHGESLETGRQWPEAIEFYEAALEKWEGDEDLKYALRRTRIHFGIDRRYTDKSFEQRLLKKGRSETLDLYEDISARVQFEYVDSISVTKFVAHGTESLYMALGNERFLSRNIPDAAPENVRRVRDTLIQQYWNYRVDTRLDARNMIISVCELADRELSLSGTAVVMEYVFGGCNALDEYSNFLTPDRFNDLFGSIQGELVGIGIEMKAVKGKGMHLVNVLLESPAEDGGLLPNDYIVAIDGVDCRDMTVDDAASLLRGQSGSTVRLSWTTPAGTTSEGSFVRRRVQIRSVTRAVMLDESQGIGYIRMEGFQNNTAEELDEALRTLERQGMKALIWDLRENPGGLLETAAAVLERFIPSGVLVSTQGRASEQNQVFRSNGYNTRTYPLVLVVDENSASASEIVAGAIHDHRRGTIVGRKTYGKWSVQSIIRLPGEADMGLKLTTAKFYSPSNQNYSGKGLAPDIEVPKPEDLQVVAFRGRTAEDLLTDPDLSRAFEVLERRLTQK